MQCCFSDHRDDYIIHDVTLESSGTQSNTDHAVYSDFSSSKPTCKADGYHAVCVQYAALSFCLFANQKMAKSKLCKVPTKEDQRLDHATKLEASLPQQRRFHCS
jgi:hypothetical protein